MEAIDKECLAQLKGNSSNFETTRWAAYQNQALDSVTYGHIRFLAVGPENTFKEPPPCCPDSACHGDGWKYRFIGWLDLETGEIRA